MARKWHSESGVNPPFNKIFERPMSKGQLLEFHRQNGTIGAFYELYPEYRPACSGVAGCPCASCRKSRGRANEYERQR